VISLLIEQQEKTFPTRSLIKRKSWEMIAIGSFKEMYLTDFNFQKWKNAKSMKKRKQKT